MRANGRPLRFLAVVLGGWTAVRVAMLWPSIDPGKALTDAIVPSVAAAPAPTTVPETPAPPFLATLVPHRTAGPARARIAAAGSRHIMLLKVGAAPRSPTPAYPPERGTSAGHSPVPPSLPLAPRAPAGGSRWSGSGWFVVRDGGGAGEAFGGSQLGGSQAGVRIAYTVDRAHRLAIAARVSTPLSGAGREMAIGVEWQPIEAPFRIVAEQRVSLDGGRGGPALGLIAGVGPAPLIRDVTIEAYGQAGAIARDGAEAFADGAVRIGYPVIDLGEVRFDLGAGAWGAAQRDAARLDIGPSLSADLPIGGAHARLSLDWRQRIAGDARPGSGLVLTLGTDF